MAITLVANTGLGSTTGNTVTTVGIDTNGATLLVVGVAENDGTIGTVSDSNGNTWTPRTSYTITGSRVKLYYASSPTVGSGHTFTYTVTGNFPTICVAAFAGTHATPYDVENGHAQSTSPGGTLTTGSVTPSADGAVLVAMLMANDSTAGSVIDSGFTITNSLDFVGGQHFEGAMAYLIETTATAKNPIWSSMDVGATASGTVASFLAAAAGGGDTTTVRNRTMMGIG